MADKSTIVVQQSGGGCLLFLLGAAVLLVALKASGLITLSWFWVLSPIWLPFAFWGAIIALIIGGALFALLVVVITGLVAATWEALH